MRAESSVSHRAACHERWEVGDGRLVWGSKHVCWLPQQSAFRSGDGGDVVMMLLAGGDVLVVVVVMVMVVVVVVVVV